MYRRTTTALRLDALPPALREGLTAHARTQQLTLAPDLACWLTHSENPPGEGLFATLLGRRANPVDPDPAHDAVLVIHPTQLLIATSRPSTQVVVLSVPLGLASVSRGSGVAAKLAATVPGADEGITVSGFPGEQGRPGTFFFGLAPGAPLEDCARAVEAAIAAAKRG